MATTPIYTPCNTKPMHIAFFSSRGPGNFQTAIETAENYPSLMSVKLLVTDNMDNPSIDLAKSKGLPIIAKDFSSALNSLCPSKNKARYQAVREQLHNEILDEMNLLQKDHVFSIDLIVLAYRRIITGRLLEHYNDRMINQHPADLSVLTEAGDRKYIGITGLSNNIQDRTGSTRTSTILVNKAVDGGDIICQGPPVPVIPSLSSVVNIEKHETLQKRISDPSSLSFALFNIANGMLRVSTNIHKGTKNRVIYFDEDALPYCGYQL